MFVVPEAKRLVQPGQTFNRLTISGVPFRFGGIQHVVAKCECGKYKLLAVNNLCRTNSCGCVRTAATPTVSHGGSGTRLYNIWAGMRYRCQNPNHFAFSDYGGRGISVCPEWSTFGPFRDWAIANGYRDDLTIDRADNNGNYEPSNCRWATYTQQNANQRRNRLLTAFGETKGICQWVGDHRCAVPHRVIADRLRQGWNAERAISTPRKIA